MVKQVNTEVWAVVHEERRALIHDLEALEASRWNTASLCAGSDVHDVVAHLVDTAKTTRRSFLRRMFTTGFDFDRDNADGIAKEKAPDSADTLAEFRVVVERTSTPPAALATRLVEAFVHGEDIRIPLGMNRDYPADHVATALGYQVKSSSKLGGGKELAEGWRLIATDTSFEHGGGPEVRGNAIVLLLAVSGSPVAPEEFAGPGAQTFVERMRTASAR